MPTSGGPTSYVGNVEVTGLTRRASPAGMPVSPRCDTDIPVCACWNWPNSTPCAHAQRYKRRPVTAFIGNDMADLLVLHVDVDLKLPFPDKVREAQFLQLGPYYWTTGTGTFDGSLGPTTWDLKATPIRQR